MAGTLLAFLLSERSPELLYTHQVVPSPGVPSERVFTFDTAAIRAELDGVPLSQPLVAGWLAEFIAEGEQSLRY
jgi:hypothetical protein